MYGIEIPISTYRTQGAITFKVLSLKHTEISASRYFLCYKKPLKLKLHSAQTAYLCVFINSLCYHFTTPRFYSQFLFYFFL